jgi:hypothetical protein
VSYVVAGSVLLVQACTTVVAPPAEPAQPRPVYLLDHGKHASLVLPEPQGGMVRYAYGDWRYYALVSTGAAEASAAVLWRTQAALGRRELSGPPSAANVRRGVRVGIEQLYEVVADYPVIEELRARLDSIYQANLETRTYNPAYDLEFVHHPQPYSAFHNSNRVVARWLWELGCDVRGLALLSKWRVQLRKADAEPRRE